MSHDTVPCLKIQSLKFGSPEWRPLCLPGILKFARFIMMSNLAPHLPVCFTRCEHRAIFGWAEEVSRCDRRHHRVRVLFAKHHSLNNIHRVVFRRAHTTLHHKNLNQRYTLCITQCHPMHNVASRLFAVPIIACKQIKCR